MSPGRPRMPGNFRGAGRRDYGRKQTTRHRRTNSKDSWPCCISCSTTLNDTFQKALKLGASPPQPCCGRADRNAEHRRDLLVIESFTMPEQKHGPKRGLETDEGVFKH